jgi:hypothetical protein
MALGAARNAGSGGENVCHFHAVRLRLQGTGNLQMAFWSMDDIRSYTIVPQPMQLMTRIEPTRLANFTEQRAAFEGKTTVINEFVKINRIIIFARPIFTSYPG